MKSYLNHSVIALAATVLAFSSVRADFDANDDDDHERGGQVEGTEELEQEVRLKPTADAPRGASGKAEIEAENENGTTTATLQVETEGLDVGTYTVSAISLSTGTSTVLGTIDVTENHDADDDDDDDQGEDRDGAVEVSRLNSTDADDEDDQGDDNDDQGENETSGDCEFGTDTSFAFPDGFNPLDVAAIEIADANGIVVLRGDFTNLGRLTKCNLQINVQVTPGDAAPTVTGTAALRVRVSRHVQRQKFLLKAQNVPVSTNLSVNVNGEPAGHVRTNRKGGVALRRLPRGISGHRVYSVSFDDPSGVRVLSAHF